jgi:nitrite reductase (NADH) small subunit
MVVRHNLGSAFGIPIGEGREFDVEGLRIAVFRSRNGSIYATQALCPHRQGSLADGLLGGSTLVCPFHAWRFELKSGQAVQGDCDIQTYPVELDDNGNVILTLA